MTQIYRINKRQIKKFKVQFQVKTHFNISSKCEFTSVYKQRIPSSICQMQFLIQSLWSLPVSLKQFEPQVEAKNYNGYSNFPS